MLGSDPDEAEAVILRVVDTRCAVPPERKAFVNFARHLVQLSQKSKS